MVHISRMCKSNKNISKILIDFEGILGLKGANTFINGDQAISARKSHDNQGPNHPRDELHERREKKRIDHSQLGTKEGKELQR